MKDLNIKSTTLEKGIDLAKDFLDKLIGPAIEETGLLLKDKVTLWKFKNQVRTLTKAKAYCQKHNISPKAISLKIICPLLDNAALEENELLQDKWAVLLANMVDSTQNIENHVFPYLLSQISIKEFMLLQTSVEIKTKRVSELKKELEEFRGNKPELEASINDKLAKLKKELDSKKEERSMEPWNLRSEISKLEGGLRKINKDERDIRGKIIEPQAIPSYELEEYELSNIIRLGLVKVLQLPYAYVDRHQIRNDPGDEYLELQDLSINIEHDDEDYLITQLGEMFIQACSEKSS